MTGAAPSETAIGQAHAAGSAASLRARIHVATASPPSTAAPAAPCGVNAAASALNSGPLKRMKATTLGTAPSGSRPAERNGKYNAASTAAATSASRNRMRFQYSGIRTIGNNLVATASTKATDARVVRPVLSIHAE